MLSRLGPIAKAALGSIGGALDRLQHLATAIRRASTSDIASRVQSFRRKFDEDDEIFEKVALLLVGAEIPKIREPMARQLAASIAFRRSRLHYQERHHRKLSKKRQVEELPTPGLEQRLLSPEDLAQPGGLQFGTRPKAPYLRRQRSISDVLSGTVPSAFDPGKFHKGISEIRSIESGPSIVSLKGGDYVYPKAPKPEPGAEFCSCPWCFEQLDVSRLEIGGWWRFVFHCYSYCRI